VDASDPAFEQQMRTTHEVLAEIGAGGTPARLVLNKCDRVDDPARLAALREAYPDAWAISAKAEADVAWVHDAVVAFFDGEREEADLDLRPDQGAVRAAVYATCEVLDERWDEAGGHLRARGTRAALARLRDLARL
jgi:GTP-binding protein HflX